MNSKSSFSYKSYRYRDSRVSQNVIENLFSPLMVDENIQTMIQYKFELKYVKGKTFGQGQIE